MTPRDLHNLGISVIPLHWRTKFPIVKWKDFQTRHPTDAEFNYWMSRGPRINYAAVTGTGGLLVIDFDTYNRFAEWRDEKRNDPSRHTYMVATSRGVHAYFLMDNVPPGEDFQV